MDDSGDEIGRQARGRSLLLEHCARLDPDTPTAMQRLELVLGPTLARRLVLALSRRA